MKSIKIKNLTDAERYHTGKVNEYYNITEECENCGDERYIKTVIDEKENEHLLCKSCINSFGRW